MDSEADFFESRFSEKIDLGPCLVGTNLNLLTLRGYSSLDRLSCISGPDIYDQVENPNGTQRELKRGHSNSCWNYASGSALVLAEDDPRYFPEIILNARDRNVVEVYELESPETLIDLDSFSDPAESHQGFVGVRVDLHALDLPLPEYSPPISRVDGNHRLSKADELLQAEFEETGGEHLAPEDYPRVGFSLLLQLRPEQEAKLFRDINGEHEGMDVAHLASLEIRLRGSAELATDPKSLPLYISDQLTQPGRAFEGKVFMGGSKVGVKKQGSIPPIRINSLKSAIKQQLDNAPTTDAQLESREALITLVDNYWSSVAQTFPEAWEDKKNYILLQAIGLGAFSRLGGVLMDRAVNDTAEDAGSVDYFSRYLNVIKAKVPLEKSSYEAIAGAAGQRLVAERLIEAAEDDEVRIRDLERRLEGTAEPNIDEVLGE
jgi:DGQHR domain-containing protein